MTSRWFPTRQPWMVGVVSLLGVLVLLFAAPVGRAASGPVLVLDLILSVASLATITVVVLRDARRGDDTAAGGLTTSQLVVLLEVVTVVFALLYFALAVHGEAQMAGLQTRIDALYFTATTMATVGYGDVHATGQLARVVVSAQLFFDVVFLALVASAARRHLGGPPSHPRHP